MENCSCKITVLCTFEMETQFIKRRIHKSNLGFLFKNVEKILYCLRPNHLGLLGLWSSVVEVWWFGLLDQKVDWVIIIEMKYSSVWVNLLLFDFGWKWSRSKYFAVTLGFVLPAVSPSFISLTSTAPRLSAPLEAGTKAGCAGRIRAAAGAAHWGTAPRRLRPHPVRWFTSRTEAPRGPAPLATEPRGWSRYVCFLMFQHQDSEIFLKFSRTFTRKAELKFLTRFRSKTLDLDRQTQRKIFSFSSFELWTALLLKCAIEINWTDWFVDWLID